MARLLNPYRFNLYIWNGQTRVSLIWRFAVVVWSFVFWSAHSINGCINFLSFFFTLTQCFPSVMCTLWLGRSQTLHWNFRTTEAEGLPRLLYVVRESDVFFPLCHSVLYNLFSSLNVITKSILRSRNCLYKTQHSVLYWNKCFIISKNIKKNLSSYAVLIYGLMSATTGKYAPLTALAMAIIYCFLQSR